MLMKMQCCKCRKTYNWYDGVYENPEYDYREAMRKRHNNEEYISGGTFIKANAIVLKKAEPHPDREGEVQEVESTDGNLNECVINLCEDCMRDLLTNIFPSSENLNCFEMV